MKTIFFTFGTPPILKFSQLAFRNRFYFWRCYKQTKNSALLRNLFHFFSCTGVISHQWLNFRLPCSVPAAWLQLACSVHRVFKVQKLFKVVTLGLKKVFVFATFKNPNIDPTWPQNHCGAYIVYMDCKKTLTLQSPQTLLCFTQPN